MGLWWELSPFPELQRCLDERHHHGLTLGGFLIPDYRVLFEWAVEEDQRDESGKGFHTELHGRMMAKENMLL